MNILQNKFIISDKDPLTSKEQPLLLSRLFANKWYKVFNSFNDGKQSAFAKWMQITGMGPDQKC